MKLVIFYATVAEQKELQAMAAENSRMSVMESFTPENYSNLLKLGTDYDIVCLNGGCMMYGIRLPDNTTVTFTIDAAKMYDGKIVAQAASRAARTRAGIKTLELKV